MKFSMCSTTKRDLKIDSVIDYASNMGLTGIEIWDGHIDEYLYRNQCGIDKLKRHLDSKNVKCVAISPYFDLLEPNSAERSIESAEKCIGYAKQLDCKIIRTFLGDKASRDLNPEEWNTCISYLKRIMLIAENHNVNFALETHNDTPADTDESILNILESVNSPFLKVLFDGFNFYVDGLDIIKAFEVLKPFIVLYHMKNYRWNEHVCVPLNNGDVDFTAIIKTLKNEHYQGFISFEFFCEEQDDLLKESMDWIKTI